MPTSSNKRSSSKAASTRTSTSTATGTKTTMALLGVIGLAAAAAIGYNLIVKNLSAGYSPRTGMPGSMGGVPGGYAPDSAAYCDNKCQIAFDQCNAAGRPYNVCLGNAMDCTAYCHPVPPGYTPPGSGSPGSGSAVANATNPNNVTSTGTTNNQNNPNALTDQGAVGQTTCLPVPPAPGSYEYCYFNTNHCDKVVSQCGASGVDSRVCARKGGDCASSCLGLSPSPCVHPSSSPKPGSWEACYNKCGMTFTACMNKGGSGANNFSLCTSKQSACVNSCPPYVYSK